MVLLIAIVLFLAIFLPGSALVWLGIFFSGFLIFCLVQSNQAEAEKNGTKPTIRMVEGKNQDIQVYIERHIEEMYANGQTDVEVAHSLDFFYATMWMFYHPFLTCNPELWCTSDLYWPHEKADAFRERMHRMYPQAYSHHLDDPDNTPEIDAEFLRFSRQYAISRYGADSFGGAASGSQVRNLTAREKSIAWTMVTHDPALGHALGHDDRYEKK